MTTKERLSRHDRQIAAIRRLIQKGMRLRIEPRKDLRATAAMQRCNEEALKQLIDSRRSTNGNTKRKA